MVLGSSGLSNLTPSGSTPSGVKLGFPKGQQYTSYYTGDEGWRVQNGFFNSVTPALPATISELDYSAGINYWYKLAQPLTVNGISSTQRFVGIDGTQNFPSANNGDKLLIDKYTGLGIFRDWQSSFITNSGFNWNNTIDNILAFSVTVNGQIFDSFFVPSLEEYLLLFGQQFFYRANNIIDPITSNVIIIQNLVQSCWCSTSVESNTTAAYSYEAPVLQMRINAGFVKTTTGVHRTPGIFDARSLIS